MPVTVKRAYEPEDPSDGRRYLIDGLWPRGVAKEKLHLVDWLREIAPSSELRRWFGHDPDRYPEFRRRYREELAGRHELVDLLAREANEGTVTLVFAARDEAHCNAAVLREVVEERSRTLPRPRGRSARG